MAIVPWILVRHDHFSVELTQPTLRTMVFISSRGNQISQGTARVEIRVSISPIEFIISMVLDYNLV